MKELLLFNIMILIIATFITIWAIFLWAVYHSLGQYPALRKIRWLAVVTVFAGYTFLEGLFTRTKLVQEHLYSWTMTVNVATSFTMNDNGWGFERSDIAVPITPFLLYAILLLVIFYVACRLLDKKVEV